VCRQFDLERTFALFDPTYCADDVIVEAGEPTVGVIAIGLGVTMVVVDTDRLLVPNAEPVPGRAVVLLLRSAIGF
jgi:hypothetical protein